MTVKHCAICADHKTASATYQNGKYGHGMRVATGGPTHRCTVCGSILKRDEGKAAK